MHLTKEFSIDKEEQWVIEHNKEVEEVIKAYLADEPIRVPILLNEWAGQHGFFVAENNLDYRQYYKNPDEMVRIQLESMRRKREYPWHDSFLGVAPKKWEISVDFWPVVAPGAFGCRLEYRANAVIAHHSRNLSIQECKELKMPDVFSGGILAKCYDYYHHIKNKYENKLIFLNSPVGTVKNGVGTNGLFSLALDLRGPEIMVDMYEKPEFVMDFFEKLATWIDVLESSWDKMAGVLLRAFITHDHGIDMLSPEHYSKFLIPVIKRHNLIRGTKPERNFHHCGRGIQLFNVICRDFNITSMNALTFPLIDIEEVRHMVGDEVWLCCCIDDALLQFGTEQQIIDTVRDLMKAKGKGRFAIQVGDLLYNTVPRNMEVLYNAVRTYGRYE